MQMQAGTQVNEADSVGSVEAGPVIDWIEKYYEEKLDKRDRSRKPGAEMNMKRYPRAMLEQMMYLN